MNIRNRTDMSAAVGVPLKGTSVSQTNILVLILQEWWLCSLSSNVCAHFRSKPCRGIACWEAIVLVYGEQRLEDRQLEGLEQFFVAGLRQHSYSWRVRDHLLFWNWTFRWYEGLEVPSCSKSWVRCALVSARKQLWCPELWCYRLQHLLQIGFARKDWN
jgi:hypothetical protein